MLSGSEQVAGRCGKKQGKLKRFWSWRKVMHKNENAIGADLVRELVDEWAPELSHLDIVALPATGSSNRLFRLGDTHLVRLPRQPGGGVAIAKEHRWTPYLSQHLAVRTPEFVKIISPSARFNEYWAIVTWLPGHAPEVADEERRPRSELVSSVARLMDALRRAPVPADAAKDATLKWYRGQALAAQAPQFSRDMEACRQNQAMQLDWPLAEKTWRAALELPRAQTAQGMAWLHADLVAENLLLENGRLTGVLDFGGLCCGDPAAELHSVWELFNSEERALFRTHFQVSEEEWLLGRAWALAIGLACLAYYWDTLPGRCQDRLVMVQAVLDDAAANGV